METVTAAVCQKWVSASKNFHFETIRLEALLEQKNLHQRLDDLYRSMQKKPRCKSEPDLRKI
ncbi:hypothetical protein ACTXT7_011706 [Hymenolepis weldensis]